MNPLQTFLLLFSLLVFISQAHPYEDGHHCNHDQIEQNPEFLDVEEDMSAAGEGEGRLLASAPHMRLYPYYEPLKRTASSAYAAYIQNELVPAVFDYFRAALRVRYPVIGNLKVGNSVRTICEINTPSVLKSGVAADMFVYFDSYADGGSQIASSKYCYLASGSNRPLVARTTFNRNMFLTPKGNVVVHEKNIYLLIHEMTHNFGFSGYNYNYYLDANGNRRKGHVKSVRIAGKTRQVLDLPPLTQRLRNYYGCPSVPGAILEDNGGSSTTSSHFERKYFVFETMSSGNVFGERVSEFTLALLEGTGWYFPDYSYAEPYHFGKGKGCNFINTICSNNKVSFSEYCTGNGRGCSAMGRGGGNCRSSSISDGCSFVFPFEDNDCENEDGEDNARFPELETYGRGRGSKCFTGTLNGRTSNNAFTHFCFKYNCVGSGSNTQLEVHAGNNKLVCTQKGQKKTISGYYGSIDCPDPQTFCSTIGRKFCPRNCMGRGTCVNGKCQCKAGYTGTDCALRA